MWSPKGGELFFRSDDQHVMVANYSVKGGVFVQGQVRIWSDKRLASTGALACDVVPDGKRIVALMPAEAAEDLKAQSHIIYVENCSEEIRRRLKP